MFEATLDEISLLRDSIATISELIDETELHINHEGMKLIASDRAVVAVVDFFLSRDAFKSYSCEKETKVGINLISLLNILRRAKDTDIMKIKLEENKLNIIIEGESRRSFSLPLIDVSREETPPLDKLEFPASAVLNTEILNSGIEDADLITDSIVFTMRKDQLSMKAESDTSSAHLELPHGEAGFRVLNINEPVRARYSLEYLKKIIKARKLAQDVTISMSNDYPMKLQFAVPNRLRMDFILAPRVEE